MLEVGALLAADSNGNIRMCELTEAGGCNFLQPL
jgi:hypothetical protein